MPEYPDPMEGIKGRSIGRQALAQSAPFGASRPRDMLGMEPLLTREKLDRMARPWLGKIEK